MIEHVPQQVDNALLYFHSAGVTSEEIRPFLAQLVDGLPNTYLWAGDGVISGAPLMRQGLHYGNDSRRYWFSFPMQDASSPASFAANTEAMGAALACAGAYVNQMADMVMARFGIPARRVALCGFQHGGCVALAAAMQRTADPYAVALLFEPYVLESYYLQYEQAKTETTVVCIDNQHIRQRTLHWMNVETDKVFASYGIHVRGITVDGGGAPLDSAMVAEAVKIIRTI
jgi:predicted esterase